MLFGGLRVCGCWLRAGCIHNFSDAHRFRRRVQHLAALAGLAGLLGWLGWLAWLAGLARLAAIQQTPSNDKEQLFLKNSHHRLQSRTMFTSKRLRLGSECFSDVRPCSTQRQNLRARGIRKDQCLSMTCGKTYCLTSFINPCCSSTLAAAASASAILTSSALALLTLSRTSNSRATTSLA